MNFIRKKDDTAYRLASMQARIFSRSGEKGIPSYSFILTFMYSSEAKSLDDLSFLFGGSSEEEIYRGILARKTSQRGGVVYPSHILHWVGFFYRYASYLTGATSDQLFKSISPKYLVGVYPAYHGLDIVKAIERAFDDNGFTVLSPQERFNRLFRKNAV